MKIDKAVKDLENILEKYYEKQGYEKEELKQLGLYRIDIKPNTAHQYTDIYIYAEMSFDDFIEEQSSWNKIVEQLDESAYFDAESSGVFVARVYWDTLDINDVLSQQNLNKFGNAICFDLDEEFGEDVFLDDISYDSNSQRLNIEVSGYTYKSSANVKVYAYDVETYQDLVQNYKDRIVKTLVARMREM